MTRHVRFTVLAGALALSLSACGGAGDNAGGTAQRPPDAVMNTPEGKAELRYNESTALPAGLPAYPGATPQGSVSVAATGPGGSGQMVSLRTADSAAQVHDFYTGAAERAGYRVVRRAAYGLTLEGPDGEGVQIQTFAAGQEGTIIQIVAGQRAR